jgi:tetratricopeptide (TPR) repeat protein
MSSNGNQGPSNSANADPHWSNFVLAWSVIGVASLIWWTFESDWCLRRFILAAGMSLAAFVAGCLIGFLFSSHNEEADTIGKVRDWVIGGITTLSIAKAGAIKATITTFAAGEGSNEYAIAFGGAVAYAGLGFLFMYFLRELYYNPRLAISRRERGIIEGTRTVDQVVKTFQVKLPPEILTGGSSVDDITNDANKQAAKELGDKLSSPEVKAFLDQANQALADCTGLDWDIISKVAYIHYYRTYFAENDNDKLTEARLAIDWIQRALLLNPHHADLTTKYADMLGVTKDFAGAVAVLEKMVHQPDAPLVVRQWLGYYLLYVPKRLADSVKYSQEFRQLVGENTDALFNIACAYAQAYCEGQNAEAGLDWATTHENALSYLRQALAREPDYVSVIYPKWTNPGESFECFAQDKEFLAMVAPKTPADATGSVPPQSIPDASNTTGTSSGEMALSRDLPVNRPAVLKQKPSDPAAPATGQDQGKT